MNQVFLNWVTHRKKYTVTNSGWINLCIPDHDVEHLGKTVIVTRTGLDSLPPQSVATTERTWLLDSDADKTRLLLITPSWLIWNGWSGLVIEYWQISPKVGEQSLSLAVTWRMKSAIRSSSTWPLYSSWLHSGIYSLTSFTFMRTSALEQKNTFRMIHRVFFYNWHP